MTAWDDTVIAIPTMPERSRILERLLGRLRTECPGAKIVTRLHQLEDSPRVDFPAIVRASMAADRPWVLQMEDDAWPAPVFGTEFPLAVKHAEQSSASAILLFSRRQADSDALQARPGEVSWRWQSASSLCMIQAIAVRRNVLLGFPEWAPSWYEAHPEHQHAADLLLGAWLSRKKAKIQVRIPSLVQHLAVPSTLPNHRGVRQSKTYLMAYGNTP